MPQLRTKTVKMLYGESTPQDCQVCWQKRTRFGSMVDPNGHIWRICAECIKVLWDSEQALNMERRVSDAAHDMAISIIQERLFGDG